MKVKICGITTVEDALLAVQQGAWAIGYVFEPKSTRYVDPKTAGKISKALPASIEKIGVFVNEAAERVNEISAKAGLTMAQLHGEETPQDAKGINIPIIKAIRLQNEAQIDDLKNWDQAKYILIDSYVEGQRGGTGKVANWPLAMQMSQKHDVILAGGLTPENLEEAIQKVRPIAVDISSGVEAETGRKSATKIKQVFTNINNLKGEKTCW